ncbi:hypothetical protein [Desertibaculum subflavum]|uniref:hypothetical protein n=1 Tax=Desertibaculum subflavum TaxID=2268458 RepID=UPI0013C481FA
MLQHCLPEGVGAAHFGADSASGTQTTSRPATVAVGRFGGALSRGPLAGRESEHLFGFESGNVISFRARGREAESDRKSR